MKIISHNVNGIRSASKKGLFEFIKSEDPDIACLQEIKANQENLAALKTMRGYFPIFNSAEKKGYSGVAVYTKNKPISVVTKIGLERFNKEGRILELEYPRFILINLYFPHGGRQKENLDYKLEVYQKVFERINKPTNKNLILIGDFNIAHKEIDLARPTQNRNNIMFTPEERKQIDNLVNLGFIDSFRQFNGETGNFTWWPYAFDARKRNLGWRLDYAFVQRGLSDRIKQARIYSQINFSDHCPIGLNIDL